MATDTALEPVVVPDSGLDGEPLFEIIDGQRVELPPMSAYAVRVAFRLMSQVNEFASPRNIGEAVTEVLFRLPLPVNRNRRPDGAFVSYERWSKDRPMPEADNAWDVVPHLAAEVVSPNDLADELMQKITEYFQAGVQLVWVVYPRQRIVHVYETLTRIRVLTIADELDGGSVVPGFRLPLASLFPEQAPAA